MLKLQLLAEHLGGGAHRCRRVGGIAQGIRHPLEKGAPAGCLRLGLRPIGVGPDPVGDVGRLDKDIGDLAGPVADRLVDKIEQALFLRCAWFPGKSQLCRIGAPSLFRIGAPLEVFVFRDSGQRTVSTSPGVALGSFCL